MHFWFRKLALSLFVSRPYALREMKTVGRCCRKSRPKAKSGVRFLGRGSKPHKLGGTGERYELPSGVRGGALTAQRFTIFSIQDGLS